MCPHAAALNTAPLPVCSFVPLTSHVQPLNSAFSFQSLTNCPRFATLSEPLSFQPITNCPICKSFALITIQQYRGWVGPPPTSPTFRKHRSASIIPFVFKLLHTLWRHGRNTTLLQSIPCALFLSPRGCVPLHFNISNCPTAPNLSPFQSPLTDKNRLCYTEPVPRTLAS
jgi:hypothetical protein